MHNVVVAPLKREHIRAFALKIRKALGIENDMWFPVMEVVEMILPTLDKDYSFHVREKDELGSNHGLTVRDGDAVSILIRDDIYARAQAGEGRDRGTVAHEIGHYSLHIKNQCFPRNFGQQVRTIEDPEWQAKCFQGELLVPKHLVHGMTAYQVAERCGVSFDAAEYQLRLYMQGK